MIFAEGNSERGSRAGEENEAAAARRSGSIITDKQRRDASIGNLKAVLLSFAPLANTFGVIFCGKTGW
jgi:hypothetical protein